MVERRKSQFVMRSLSSIEKEDGSFLLPSVFFETP
jgi:hypothetical protein